MRPPQLPFIALLGSCALLASSPAAAYSRAEVEHASGLYLSWSKRVLGYALNQQGCPGLALAQLEQVVAQAFASWSIPDCTDLAFDFLGAVADEQTNLTLGPGQAPDGRSLLVWRHESWPPAGVSDATVTAEMPAVTSLLYDAQTGEIFDADIDLNAVHFSWGVQDGTSEAFADVQSIVTHEVGHLIGLGHSSNAQATMYPTIAAGETKKRTLAADDLAGLCFVYPAGLPTPAGPGDGDPASADTGGCSLAAAAPPGRSPRRTLPGAWTWGLLLAAGCWRLAKAARWRLAKAARRRYTAAP